MKNLEILFESEKIEYFSVLPIEKTEIINQRLMPTGTKKAIVFLIPYRTDYLPSAELAHFARIKDYHVFAKSLFSRLIPVLNSLYPQKNFIGFADHSPINERKLAFEGGLGVIGKNGLLINEKYGSYVFIGEILTDAEIPSRILSPQETCTGCEKCIKICPKTDFCISEISQKKRKTEADLLLLKKNNVIWGCDKCQEICPTNTHASLSPFQYFYENKISSPKEILSATDERFDLYAFSYRGRRVIEENIENIFKKDID